MTAFDQYALRAFEVHALDYLLKPFEADRFHNALVRARANLSPARDASYPGEDRLRRLLAEVLGGGRETESAPKTTSPYFERVAVKTDGATRILQIADVDWFETDGNYVRVHVGKSTYLIRSTANRLQEELDPRRFARIHRRFLVNVDRVVGLEPWFGGDAIVLLRDGSKLRLSRNYREGFLPLMLGGSQRGGGSGRRGGGVGVLAQRSVSRGDADNDRGARGTTRASDVSTGVPTARERIYADDNGYQRIAPWWRRDLSAGPSKILMLWMERSGARARTIDPESISPRPRCSSASPRETDRLRREPDRLRVNRPLPHQPAAGARGGRDDTVVPGPCRSTSPSARVVTFRWVWLALTRSLDRRSIRGAEGAIMVECDDAVVRELSPTEPLLQLAASGYERAQRDRIRYGEQLRAILQGRDAWELSVDVDASTDADALLREIRESGGGPVPMLGRLYAAAWKQECERWARRCIRSSAGIRRGRGCGACVAWVACSRRDFSRGWT